MSDEFLAIKERPARWAVWLAIGSAVFAGASAVLLLLTFL